MSYIKYTLEYPLRTSQSVLYRRISTPGGLSEWFADNVTIKENILTFYWEGSEERAKILKVKKGDFVKYKWIDNDDPNDNYFELVIQIDDMTKDISLIITDFAEDEYEKDDLWELMMKQTVLRTRAQVKHRRN